MGARLAVFVHVDLGERDVVVLEPLSGPRAVRTPGAAIHHQAVRLVYGFDVARGSSAIGIPFGGLGIGLACGTQEPALLVLVYPDVVHVEARRELR